MERITLSFRNNHNIIQIKPADKIIDYRNHGISFVLVAFKNRIGQRVTPPILTSNPNTICGL